VIIWMVTPWAALVFDHYVSWFQYWWGKAKQSTNLVSYYIKILKQKLAFWNI